MEIDSATKNLMGMLGELSGKTQEADSSYSQKSIDKFYLISYYCKTTTAKAVYIEYSVRE